MSSKGVDCLFSWRVTVRDLIPPGDNYYYRRPTSEQLLPIAMTYGRSRDCQREELKARVKPPSGDRATVRSKTKPGIMLEYENIIQNYADQR